MLGFWFDWTLFSHFYSLSHSNVPLVGNRNKDSFFVNEPSILDIRICIVWKWHVFYAGFSERMRYAGWTIRSRVELKWIKSGIVIDWASRNNVITTSISVAYVLIMLDQINLAWILNKSLCNRTTSWNSMHWRWWKRTEIIDFKASSKKFELQDFPFIENDLIWMNVIIAIISRIECQSMLHFCRKELQRNHHRIIATKNLNRFINDGIDLCFGNTKIDTIRHFGIEANGKVLFSPFFEAVKSEWNQREKWKRH